MLISERLWLTICNIHPLDIFPDIWILSCSFHNSTIFCRVLLNISKLILLISNPCNSCFIDVPFILYIKWILSRSSFFLCVESISIVEETFCHKAAWVSWCIIIQLLSTYCSLLKFPKITNNINWSTCCPNLFSRLILPSELRIWSWFHIVSLVLVEII